MVCIVSINMQAIMFSQKCARLEMKSLTRCVPLHEFLVPGPSLM